MDIAEAKSNLETADKLKKNAELQDALHLYNDVIDTSRRKLTGDSDDINLKWQSLLALALNERGHTKYLQVDFDEAVEDYSAAIDIQDDLAVAYYNRGLVHYRLARYDLAIPDLKKTLQLDPKFTSASECLKQCQQDITEVQHNPSQ